jgi:hypothetical protein
MDFRPARAGQRRSQRRARPHTATRIIRRLVPRCLFPFFFPPPPPATTPTSSQPIAQAGHPVFGSLDVAGLRAAPRLLARFCFPLFSGFSGRAARRPLVRAAQQVADYKNHSSARGRDGGKNAGGKIEKKRKERRTRSRGFVVHGTVTRKREGRRSRSDGGLERAGIVEARVKRESAQRVRKRRRSNGREA